MNGTTIKKIKLEPDDMILIEVDPEIIDLDSAYNITKNIIKEFSEHKVLCYLKGINIHITKEKDFEYIKME